MNHRTGPISVLYMNERSLIHKHHALLVQIPVEKLDVVVIIETLATTRHLMLEVSIGGFDFYHKIRLYKKK